MNFDIDLKESSENYFGKIDFFSIDDLKIETIYFRNKLAFDNTVVNSKAAFKRFEQHTYPPVQQAATTTGSLDNQRFVRIEILSSTNNYFSKGQMLNFNEADRLFSAYDTELSEQRNKLTIGPDGRYIGGCRTEFMLHLPNGQSHKLFLYF